MLEKEFQYYLDNQEELVKKYNNKHLVIVDETVVGAYDTTEDAYLGAISKYEEGTFLLQLCSHGDDSYSHTFHTRVIFN